MATSETGRRLRGRLLTEADPDLRAALEEWDPLLREVARAVRLAAREIDETVERAAQFISEMSVTELEPARDAASTDVEHATMVDTASTGPAVLAVIDADAGQGAEPR